MYNLILKSRPLSYNSCRGFKKANYKTAIKTCFTKYNPTHSVQNEYLYAIVYYFYNKDLHLDTDNLSKPIWDCLNGFIFHDDQQIKVRIAGSFDLSKGDYSEIDFTGLQGQIVLDLLEAFEKEEHVVYIECGSFKPSMFKFNME